MLAWAAALLSIPIIASGLVGPLRDDPYAAILPYGLTAIAIICALAFAQPLALFVAGIALLAAVRTEPAPVDVIFAILMIVTFLQGRVSPRIPVPIEIVLALTAFLTLLSAVNAVDTARAIKYGFVSLYLLAFGVWLTWVFTNPRATRLAIKAYIIAAFVSAILTVLALYAGLPGRSFFLFDEARGKGLFKDPNVYAAFLVPAAAITLEEIGRPRLLRYERKVAALLFVVITAGVVIGFSRAAWLNLTLACATVITVTALRRGGTRRALRSLSALALAGAAGFGLLLATGSLTFFQQRSQLESYDEQRFNTQASALSRVGDHLFGYGPGQVERTLDISTHSLYARAAFEQGPLGLILMALLLVGTLYYGLVLVRADADVHGIGSAALLASWLGLVANGIFIDAVHWRHLYVIAALIWCGAAMYSSRPPLKSRVRSDDTSIEFPRHAKPG